MNAILTILHLTLLEAKRRRILLAGLVCGLAFVALFATGLSFIARAVFEEEAVRWQELQRQAALHFLTIAGLYVANFLTLIIAVLLPIDTLSGEIASGVAQTLAAKPIRRAEIVIGKWLAYWILVLFYLAVTAGGVILASWIIGGLMLPNLDRALPLMLLESTVMLSVAIAGGARFSTVTNAIVAFGIYGLAFIGGWVEQVGEIMVSSEAARDAVRNTGTSASLVSPTDALWRLAAYQMMPGFIRDLPAPPLAAFGAMVPASGAMVVWAVGYMVVMLMLALRRFEHRAL